MPYTEGMNTVALTRSLLAALLLVTAAASAAPTVTSIEPNVGFTYKRTLVTIHGSDFSESDFSCQGDQAPFCPASVFFGPSGLPGTVVEVTPTTIKVLVPARPHGEAGPVLVKVVRKGEVVFNSFRWDQAKLSDDPNDYDRYLIPITTRGTPGAHGSYWIAEWLVRGHTQTPFAAIWPSCPPLANPCFESLIGPGVTQKKGIYSRFQDGTDGAFLYMPKGASASLAIRVRDLSKNATSFGAEIPVVRDSDYRSSIEFLDIPTDPKYRSTLRIYGPDPVPHKLTVSVFSEKTGALIEEYEVELKGIVNAAPERFPLNPSYAELDPLSPAVRASGESVRVVVYSVMWWILMSPPPPYPVYAFMTVTNNETQQITVIEPKP